LAFVAVLALIGCSQPNTDASDSDAESPSRESHVVILTPAQVQQAKITTTRVARGSIARTLSLNGEVEFDRNHLAHLTSRVPGVVRALPRQLGDTVKQDEVLLVLESRDLTTAKSAYLAAQSRLELEQSNFERLKGLWQDKIAAEHDFLTARQAQAEAKIAFETTKQTLLALGLSNSEIARLPQADPTSLGHYELRAPFAGTLVEQHVTLGEQVQPDEDAFVLAALDEVWLTARVYEDEIARVQIGQHGTVTVRAHRQERFSGTVTWIADAMDQATRTLPVRLNVPNEKRQLKAGMFAEVALNIGSKDDVLTVPSSALEVEPNAKFVFVQTEPGHFERRDVEAGIRSEDTVEITSGLREGEQVVATGGFLLKSELEKGAFGDND